MRVSPVRIALVLIAALSAMYISGCRNQFSISAPAYVPEIKSNDYLAKDPDSNTPSYKADIKAYLTYTTKSTLDLDQARQRRNDIVYNLMSEIDKVYGEYAIRLNSGKATEAVTFDSVTLGLSSAATIAGNAATKTLLSAIGTGVGGAGQSFDKNFFSQQTFAVLAIAMQTRRDKIRQNILSNLLNDDVTVYPLSAAKRDLVAYYYAGTLSGGLQELQEEAGSATGKTATTAVATPTFLPPIGPYSNTSVPVTISDSTPGVTIYYTTDGSTPSNSSNSYSGPVTVTSALPTIKAIAVVTGGGSSAVGSATYKLGDITAPPLPPGGAAAPVVPPPPPAKTPLFTAH